MPGRPPHPADELLVSLTSPDEMRRRHPLPGLDEVGGLTAEARRLNRGYREGKIPRAERDAARKRLQTLGDEVRKATILRAVDSPTPFRERLVAFYVDHFTARPGLASWLAPFIDEAIRTNVAARFEDLLWAVARQPAMLFYLDQNGSIGPGSRFGEKRGLGLNENYARELLELHTLGVDGTYTQADVRQLAELLTGMRVNLAEGFRFDERAAEPGAETVLGRTYGGRKADERDVQLALADLARHPDTARHMARKLAVHFVADDPPVALVGHVAAAWTRSGGDLLQVYAALLEHPAAWELPLRKVKQPADFLVSAIRALGVDGAALSALTEKNFRRAVTRPARYMGQPLLAPDGPDGWDEAPEAWITPQGLASRIQWAMQTPPRLVEDMPDPRDFVEAALGPLASPRLRWAAGAAETRGQGVAVVLASPDFNRR
ncbi:DUF1800 domain-containing protein [Palleronia sediminis]|uniref:DUF1800 domain-containing protein n=2 Tax=Palleronia sediminis TaxID=2547833 RepID=A0A4R6A0Z7_9RHOB|nr:DUF1800 domain-containing protein [Palleronia sediminis]